MLLECYTYLWSILSKHCNIIISSSLLECVYINSKYVKIQIAFPNSLSLSFHLESWNNCNITTYDVVFVVIVLRAEWLQHTLQLLGMYSNHFKTPLICFRSHNRLYILCSMKVRQVWKGSGVQTVVFPSLFSPFWLKLLAIIVTQTVNRANNVCVMLSLLQ